MEPFGILIVIMFGTAVLAAVSGDGSTEGRTAGSRGVTERLPAELLVSAVRHIAG
jgi:hypothetical protein